MRILACDTSGADCSVAVSDNGRIIGSYSINRDRQHSALLMPMIENLFSTLEISPSDIDAFSVNKGPGSFTGLRIGMAVIKGMALALERPVYSFDTFEAQAEPLRYFKGNIMVLNDALRGTYYSTVLTYREGRWERMAEDGVRTLGEALELRKSYKGTPFLITGDVLLKDAERVKGLFPEDEVAGATDCLSRAESLLTLTERAVELGLDPENPLPYYMRKPQAEREYDEKHGIR